MASSRRSGRELGRVALPTVQRRLGLSRKLRFNSLWPVTNVTGQGNGLRIRIVREKRGGPGITVKAKKNKTKQLNPLVCTRQIPSIKFGDWRQRVGCHSEVKLLMQLEHSNIVRYMESFEERGVLHLVTDYAECGNLGLKIEARRSLGHAFTREEALDLLTQIMLALDYLHRYD